MTKCIQIAMQFIKSEKERFSLKDYEKRLEQIERRIGELNKEIQLLKGEKYTIKMQLRNKDIFIIKELPNKAQLILARMGIKKDAQLVEFVKGNYSGSNNSEDYYYRRVYCQSRTMEERLMSIYGIGKMLSQEIIKTIKESTGT